MNLYDLKDKYLEALHNLEVNEDGEVIGIDNLEQFKEDVRTKALNYAKGVKLFRSDLSAIAEEAKRIAAIKRGVERKIEWFERAIAATINEGEKVMDLHASISWMKSERLEVNDPNSVPEHFTTTEIQIQKDAIKRAMKLGEYVPGVELVTKQNLQIK